MLREFYRRNLPHILPLGATFFVTFRLYGSLPKVFIDQLKFKKDEALANLAFCKNLSPEDQRLQKLKIEKQYWQAFNDALDTIKEGPHHIKIPELAQIVVDRMKSYDDKYYQLCAYVIMSNHVHALLDFSKQLETIEGAITDKNYKQLEKIMGYIKGGSAKYCNDWLKEHNKPPQSPFWAQETFDRYIRDQKHYDNTVDYILNNPVKIGLCDRWEDYPFAWQQ